MNTLKSIKTVISAIVTLMVMVAPHYAAAKIIDRIVAKVDDEIITLYDLEAMKSRLPAYPGTYEIFKNLETDEEKDRYILEMLIGDLLIEKENAKYGLTPNEDDVRRAIRDTVRNSKMSYDEFVRSISRQGITEMEYKRMMIKQIAKMRFYTRFINSKVMVTDTEILTFFRENEDFFRRNREVRLLHILFLKDDDPDKARELANEF